MPAGPLYSWDAELGRDAMMGRLKWRFQHYQHLSLDVRGAWKRDPGQHYDPGGLTLTSCTWCFLVLSIMLDSWAIFSFMPFHAWSAALWTGDPSRDGKVLEKLAADPICLQLVVLVIVTLQWHRNIFPEVNICFSIICSKGKHRSCAVACLVSDWFQCGVLLPSWYRWLGTWHNARTDKNSVTIIVNMPNEIWISVAWNAARQLRFWEEPMNFEVTLSLREKVKRALQEYQLVPGRGPSSCCTSTGRWWRRRRSWTCWCGGGAGATPNRNLDSLIWSPSRFIDQLHPSIWVVFSKAKSPALVKVMEKVATLSPETALLLEQLKVDAPAWAATWLF